jgi:hypothetical protein
MDQLEKINEIANFFWVGTLTKFEIVCITSFIKAGFKVKLWSYNNLSIPGVESCDASLILPYEDVSLYKQRHHHGDQETSTAFSDAFRWNLINKFGGWWFDADCFCLKSSEDFYNLRKDKPIVVGLESLVHPFVGSAAFYIDQSLSKYLIQKLKELSLKYDYTFPIWGMIGPRLITQFIHDNKLYDGVLDQSHFFSIGFEDYHLFLKDGHKKQAKSLIKDSYLTHIWHSAISSNDVQPDSLFNELIYDNYVNNSSKNHNINKHLSFYDRFINISKLYHNILGRSPDLEGLHNYIESDISFDDIKNIMINSKEYKNK